MYSLLYLISVLGKNVDCQNLLTRIENDCQVRGNMKVVVNRISFGFCDVAVIPVF